MHEAHYLHYFEQLAQHHAALNHSAAENKKSFFSINNPYETSEFDQALRATAAETVLLLDAPTGYLSDNGSNNCTQCTKIDYMILQKTSQQNIPEARALCFQISTDILSRIRSDARARRIIPGHAVYFETENIAYDLVGPINLNYYGYAFHINFICPFSFSSQTGAWTDLI